MPSRILIVDDHPTFRQTARRLLEARGYVVSEAGSSAEALEALRCDRADGVMLDLQLGAESGLVVCGSLVRAFPGLAVLLVSARDPGEISELIDANGAMAFLPKVGLATTNLSQFWPVRPGDDDVGSG